jgi:hypothetical protein
MRIRDSRHMDKLISRRQLNLLLMTAPIVLAMRPDAPHGIAGRRLDFQVDQEFEAGVEDIAAVLRSAAESIWQHCRYSRWEVPGFYIFPSDDTPITHYDRRHDGRVVIGLSAGRRRWAQFAYQFSHEFCHALAGHSNEWRRLWRRRQSANDWLEESICETASLFALRAMAERWKTQPPIPNWRDDSISFSDYAADRINRARLSGPPDQRFRDWLRENEPEMRQNSILRAKNNVVALRMLPLFEAQPAGWEAITSLNLTPNRDPNKRLAVHFADWRAVALAEQKPFITRLAALFEIDL